MSQQRLFPFRRVAVDHMIRGVTRVWWQLEPGFNDPGPRIFQLQFGNTGLRDSPDWHNVGGPVIDGYLAYDDAWRNAAGDLLTHYRVTLTTDKDIYVSQAVSCFGELGAGRLTGSGCAPPRPASTWRAVTARSRATTSTPPTLQASGSDTKYRAKTGHIE